jgi:hypothetical protein
MTGPFPSHAPGRLEVAPAVARLAARGLGQRAVVRTTRLEAAPGRLVLTRAGRAVRTLRVGPDGDVASAVHIGGPVLEDVAPHSLGAVDLLGPTGDRVARLDLADWVPEADELTRSRAALDRSGLVPLLEEAGLPLRPVPASELAAAVRARPPSLAPWRRLPPAYTALRSVAVVVAAAALVWGIVAGVPAALWVPASLGLLLSTLAAAGLWARAVVQDRIDDGGAPVLRPHPGGPVTRRFLRVARVRLEPDEVVVLDGLGRERRLPRTGPGGIGTAAIVREGTAQAQVELRTLSGTPRATLPWASWCGGPGGPGALEETCAAAGLPVQHGAAPARRPQAEEQAARAVHSPPGRELVAAHTWPHGVPGQAAVVQSAAFAGLLALYGLGGAPALAQAALVATLALTALPQAVRLLGRRLWLDRPVRSS